MTGTDVMTIVIYLMVLALGVMCTGFGLWLYSTREAYGYFMGTVMLVVGVVCLLGVVLSLTGFIKWGGAPMPEGCYRMHYEQRWVGKSYAPVAVWDPIPC